MKNAFVEIKKRLKTLAEMQVKAKIACRTVRTPEPVRQLLIKDIIALGEELRVAHVLHALPARDHVGTAGSAATGRRRTSCAHDAASHMRRLWQLGECRLRERLRRPWASR